MIICESDESYPPFVLINISFIQELLELFVQDI